MSSMKLRGSCPTGSAQGSHTCNWLALGTHSQPSTLTVEGRTVALGLEKTQSCYRSFLLFLSKRYDQK